MGPYGSLGPPVSPRSKNLRDPELAELVTLVSTPRQGRGPPTMVGGRGGRGRGGPGPTWPPGFWWAHGGPLTTPAIWKKFIWSLFLPKERHLHWKCLSLCWWAPAPPKTLPSRQTGEKTGQIVKRIVCNNILWNNRLWNGLCEITDWSFCNSVWNFSEICASIGFHQWSLICC